MCGGVLKHPKISAVESLAEDDKLIEVINSLHKDPWPEFLSADQMLVRHWRKLYEVYPEYQLLFKISEEYVGVANAFPMHWSGDMDELPSGFDEAIEAIAEGMAEPNTMAGMAIVVGRAFSGRGISSAIIQHLKDVTSKSGYDHLLFPVRPTLKSLYPLIPMDDYVNWEIKNLPYDPWLRVHVRSGGKILKVAYPSMTVKGTIAEWQMWTGLHFGQTGTYVVEGALNPVEINLERDEGVYIEANVWVKHEC